MGRVAAVIFNLSKGGAQGVFVNVVNYLYKNGIEIEVVTQNLNNAIYQEDLNSDIRITDMGVTNAKKLLPALTKYITENEISCALGFSPEIAVNLYIVRRILKRNFLIIGRCINTLSYEYRYTNSWFRKNITHKLIKCFYHKIDYSIAQSSGMAEDLITNYGFTEEQTLIINNALSPDFEKELSIINQYSERENFVLYAGRLESQKGLIMLLEAFSKLNDCNIRLKLVGSGSLKSELQKKAETLGIRTRVDFIEHTKNIISFYKSAKATVLTSYYEGFPNVLVESLACGTPVVAYDLPSGPSEIIMEGINGYLANYLDVNDFTEKLDICLRSKWNCEKIKKTAQRYSRETIMQKYLDLLKN